MTTAEAIRNRIIKTELVDIDKLTPFQGKLKTLDDKNFNKLRKSIIEEGFSFTVHVWENGGVTYIIDGHQRVSVLTQMRKQGIKVPPITCAFVSAQTYRDAKKLVLLAISQYGKIQKDGFLDFVDGEDFDFGDYDFPDLSFDLNDLFPEKIDLGSDEEQPDDDEEEEPAEPIDELPVEVPTRVKAGDIYSLGDHVLVCGDSNNAALVHSVIAENEADAIVTDPPYGLSFMGKEWDRGVPSKHMWETWISRAKPGSHLLSFSGTRTYHLMTTAIEEAGFEIRDMMQWIYGQGFPKSLDISKAIDKEAGAERKVIGKKSVTRDFKNKDYVNDHSKATEVDITAAATAAAKYWEGYGTALKPANEPICLARKPISESTIAKNVLKHGTGGLNIDGSRIATDEVLARLNHTPSTFNHKNTTPYVDNSGGLGRFPSNVILDEGAAAVLDEQSGVAKPKPARTGVKGGSVLHGGGIKPDTVGHWPEDVGGGASRFFKVINVDRTLQKHESQNAEDPACSKTFSASNAALCSAITSVTEKIVRTFSAQENAELFSDLASLCQTVLYAENNADCIVINSVHEAVRTFFKNDLQFLHGQVSTLAHNGQIPRLCHAMSVAIKESIDTTKIIQIQMMLNGFVNLVIESIITWENEGLNLESGRTRFIYQSKASKSDRGEGNTHATVKPISLMRYLIKLVSPPSGLVLEPFCGSGTTLLACEKEGARCIGFELDPKHCDIILARWEGLTGKKAEKVSDGR